jgi:hypothetical protein
MNGVTPGWGAASQVSRFGVSLAPYNEPGKVGPGDVIQGEEIR